MHQLLEQSARDGGCEDFGKAVTHLHYHPVIFGRSIYVVAYDGLDQITGAVDGTWNPPSP